MSKLIPTQSVYITLCNKKVMRENKGASLKGVPTLNFNSKSKQAGVPSTCFLSFCEVMVL